MKKATQSNIPYQELKKMILSCSLPETMQLKQGNFICDVKSFLEIHFKTIECNPGRKVVFPFYKRLVTFYDNIQKTA